jgi:TolA-binding protein
MKKIVPLLFIATVLMLSTGCSSITMLRTQELRAVQSKVDSLETELSSQQEQIIKTQKQNTEMLRLIRADQQVRFGELDRQVSALSNSISESQARLSQIDEKTREIKQAWEERARADSLTDAAQVEEIENLFDVARKDFTAGRYDIALAGFQDLYNRFPDSDRGDDAAYWIAECQYAQRNYAQAEEAYKNYLKSYPEGRNTCVSLFKLGLVFDNQKREKAHEMVWRKLLEQCPDAEEAAAVKARMGW